jgi:hypothetical protein
MSKTAAQPRVDLLCVMRKSAEWFRFHVVKCQAAGDLAGAGALAPAALQVSEDSATERWLKEISASPFAAR